jgi:hypothetical protein
MRHEIEEIILKRERSVVLLPKTLKSMVKQGLETMVAAGRESYEWCE